MNGFFVDIFIQDFPAEFNAWVAFRGLVEVVLALDLVRSVLHGPSHFLQGTYFIMCLVLFEAPSELSLSVLAGYLVGCFLCFIGLWAKSDAYRVIGDFAWSASLSLPLSLILYQTGATFSSSLRRT